MPSPNLSERQAQILRAALSPYAHKIDRAALFGSRATGNARANSDIDLVLYGTLDLADIARIKGLFEESGLAVPVDVVVYHLVAYLPFKQHIDAVALTLFTRADLEKP